MTATPSLSGQSDGISLKFAYLSMPYEIVAAGEFNAGSPDRKAQEMAEVI
jgi:hypothetical protein